MTTDTTGAATIGRTGLPAAAAPARRVRVSRGYAWLVVPVYAAGVLAHQVFDRRLGSPGLDPVEGTILWIGFGMFAGLGALLVLRRPGNAIGWIMSVSALLLGPAAAGDRYAAWVMTTSGRPDTAAVLGAWVQGWYWYVVLGLVFVYLPLLFPDGRLPSRRWWPVAVVPGLALLGIVVLGMFSETLTGQDVAYRIDNPLGVTGLGPIEEEFAFAVLSPVLTGGIFGGIAAVIVRFRRSRGAERQQMKWFVVAVAPAVLAPLEGVSPVLSAGAFIWLLLAVPVAITVAVLRYRLDGIDVVIDRALVYGALTALVVGVYVLVVGYLGAALRREDDLLISLVATGIVAVLFAPARDRLQKAVNRLLYGRRDEPYTALAQLGERLEGTLASEAVMPTIVSTVRDALRLPYAAIRPAGEEAAVTSGEPTTATETLPLLHHGMPVGSLVLGLRPGETTFSPADRRLLGDLARQAGVAMSAVRLTADLQRSRERLVTAREEERRRLRRDLHDGLGAQLAGLTVQAGVLRSLIPRDPAGAGALAAELRTELRSSIADVRRLVHDLRPPALDELGLAGALQRVAEAIGAHGAPIRVEVDVAPLPPLPAAVEVAAYRIVQEALTNVVRHSGARRCAVAVTTDGDDLVVTVSDDGTGLPGALVPGVGLASMRERATETGGGCTVGPGPDGGTEVRAVLPLAGPA